MLNSIKKPERLGTAVVCVIVYSPCPQQNSNFMKKTHSRDE